jgi:hypothetical protein
MCAMPVHLGTVDIVGGNSDISGNMATTITSLYQNIDEGVSFSVQASYTGSPVGTIQLQASNDVVLSSAQSPTNWTPIPKSVVAITTAGNYMVNYDLPAFTWIQLVYTPISGTGTMYANLNTKRR